MDDGGLEPGDGQPRARALEKDRGESQRRVGIVPVGGRSRAMVEGGHRSERSWWSTVT
jgi:hypothetical protein